MLWSSSWCDLILWLILRHPSPQLPWWQVPHCLLQWPHGDHVRQIPSLLGYRLVTPGFVNVFDSIIKSNILSDCVAHGPYWSKFWAQVEWWLEHRHGWLVKPQWAGSVLGRVTRYEYQVLGSTSIPARLDTLVYWEPFSWLTSVGTTRNTVIRLGWSRIGLAVLNLHAAGVGLIGRPAVISGRYNKCHSLQLQNHYAHFPPLHHTHIHAKHNRAEPVMGNGYGFRGIVCWPWQEKSCVIG